MKAFINGEIVEFTEKEEQEFLEEISKIETPQIVTDKQRISAIESAIADLAILLANNENIKED